MLNTETEIKIILGKNDFKNIRARLKENGAVFEGITNEANHLLDDGGGTIKKQNMVLRIREHLNTGEGLLTIKLPLEKTKSKLLKIRPEPVNSKIKQPKKLLNSFLENSFKEVFTYKKKREEWSLKKLHIALDTLPRLGNFAEIEGTEKDIKKAVVFLGLQKYPSTIKSYPELYGKTTKRRTR